MNQIISVRDREEEKWDREETELCEFIAFIEAKAYKHLYDNKTKNAVRLHGGELHTHG